MPLPANKQKKIIDILDALPPEKVDEIIDFAEYLKKKKGAPKRAKRATTAKVPIFHLGKVKKKAFDRDQLYGEYLDRKLD